MKSLIVVCLAIGLLGCDTLPSNPATSGAAVHPGNIYDVCLPIEAKLMKARKEANPELVAHYLCSVYKGVCKDEPNGDSCQKGIREYAEKMK